MAGLQLVTGPTVEPVSLAEMKAQIRVDANDEDALIAGYVRAAREHVEQTLLSRAMLTQTWALWLDAWPGTVVNLPYPPLQSVTSILYYDEAGTEYTYSAANYLVDTVAGRIVLKSAATWPTLTLREANGVKITFVVGYTGVSFVPQRWKQAVLLLAADLYENRENTLVAQGVTVMSVPFGVRALLANDRVRVF